MVFCGFAAGALWRPKADLPRAARAGLLGAIGAYLLHAVMSVHLEKMVFYGRVLMVFIPFLVAGTVLGLARMPWPRVRRVGVGVLIIASGGSFMSFAREYAKVKYPADFLHETMAEIDREVSYPAHILWGFVDGNPDDTIERLDPEFSMVLDTLPEGMHQYILLASHQEVRESGGRFIGVNFKWLFHVRERDRRFTPPVGYKLRATAVHPTAFPATGYEAYKPWGRQRLATRRYLMRIYERTAAPESLTLTARD